MQITPEHRMVLESVDDDKFQSFSIVNPSYIYKIGDIINIRYVMEDPLIMQRVEVTDVLQEINYLGDGEQYITIYVKKVNPQ